MDTEEETVPENIDVLTILKEVTDELHSIDEITNNIAVLLAHQIDKEDYFAEVLEEVEHLATESTETMQVECDDELRSELCSAMRSQQDSIKRPRFSHIENTLFKLTGIDPDTAHPDEVEQKMQAFFLANYKCLECTSFMSPFPRGNYLKQLASGNYLRQFRDFLRSYKFPVNIIDESDGCTVLDYVDAQIRRTHESATSIHEYLQKLRALLIREGAKHANDLGGKC